MQTSKAEPLDERVETLDRLIGLMQNRGLAESAQFLAIARTQFLIESNGISDDEFRALCDGSTESSRPSGATRRRAHRRDSGLHAMRRAWQCPQDMPAGADAAARRRARQPKLSRPLIPFGDQLTAARRTSSASAR